jgi:ribosome-binding protein aMBF1 (putative translation factor)
MSDERTLPFTCPICGRKTDHPVALMQEGAELTCPFCKLKLTLHGHMWGEIQGELEKLKGRQKGPKKRDQ